jgi:hypothetical protein
LKDKVNNTTKEQIVIYGWYTNCVKPVKEMPIPQYEKESLLEGMLRGTTPEARAVINNHYHKLWESGKVEQGYFVY